MRIDKLSLQGFRNYDTLDVSFAPDCNVIVGENAQGKTNLLEAIVYLSSARSPSARSTARSRPARRCCCSTMCFPSLTRGGRNMF